MTEYLCILLPLPPSANRLNRATSKRGKPYPSPQYTRWSGEAYYALKQQNVSARFAGPVKVTIARNKATSRGQDVDNAIKAVLDFLTSPANVYADDSQVHDVRAYWSDDVTNGCRVEVEAL